MAVNPVDIEYANTTQVDAFGRLRISEPTVVFNSNFRYDTQPLLWSETVTGSGSTTYLPNQSTVQMSINGAGSVIRQSKLYIQYVPGKSQFILLTGLMPQAASVTCRIGYFDDNNGLFFEQTAAGISVNVRTYTSGAPVTTSVAQASWNVDKFDGSGPSGYTLDLSKCQIYAIDLEWLAVGRVRFGFVMNGLFYVAHILDNANNITLVYMTTAKLPVRYEISGTGTGSMLQICSTVMSEGGTPPNPIIFTTDTGTTSITVAGTAFGHLLSVRLQAAYNRATLQPILYSTLRSGVGTFFYQVLLNPTLSGAGVVWNPIPNTYGEQVVGNTNVTVTGGYVLDSGYVSKAALNSNQVLRNSYLGINANIIGTSDILTIYIYNISGGNDDFFASFQFAQIT
jgi:hypothetical protein